MFYEENFPCACCGFQLFSAPLESAEICGVCGWVNEPEKDFDENILSDAQAKVLKWLPKEVKVYQGIFRDKSWAPINPLKTSSKRASKTIAFHEE